MHIFCKNIAERLRFAETNKKTTVYLRTPIVKEKIQRKKNEPGKMVELVGFTAIPKTRSCKPIIIENNN